MEDKNGMYLVCYFAVYSKNKSSLMWQLMSAINGPVVHMELVFVRDNIATAFTLTSRTAFPVFRRGREFDETVMTETLSYKPKWYKFVNLHHDAYYTAFHLCEQITQKREYEMDHMLMMGSTLPEVFESYFDYLAALIFGEDIRHQPQDGRTSMYCSLLIGTVLNQVFDDKQMPVRFTNKMNSSDLLANLLKVGLVSFYDGVPVKKANPKINGESGPLDGDIESQEGYLDHHHNLFTSTELKNFY